MSVFRVEKSKDFTVMSNHHLRDKILSLKAKGLLSQMLSLPEDWDYTLKGLAAINRESIDAIRQAILELEDSGYVMRSRARDEKGCLRGTEYIIYERPQGQDHPMLGNPTLDNPALGNPMQLNKDIQNKELQSIDSIPFFSEETRSEGKGNELATQSAIEVYREVIKENIEYDSLSACPEIDSEELDGIVDLLLETICTDRETIRVAGGDYPSEFVKMKLLRLNSEHIKFVMDCLKRNTTQIRNIKKYLLTMLFNAPSTMNSYYTAQVAHDMAGE